MSLNWDATSLPAERLLYKFTAEDGTQHEQPCPKLHRFIWLTMSLNRNMTGGPKAKAEFKRRFHAISLIAPSLIEIRLHESNIIEHPEFWFGANADGTEDKTYTYRMTEDDVDDYWGLETNVFGREAFSKWLVGFIDRQRVINR